MEKQNEPKKKKRKVAINENPFKYFHFLRTETDAKNPDRTKNMYSCELCNDIFNGKNISNLKSHLKSCHKNQYAELTSDENSEPIAVQRLRLIQNITEMISVNGRSFKSVLDSGFQKVIKGKLDFLQKNGHGLNLKDKNLSEIKNHLSQTATKIRKKIANEVNGLMLSLMVDIVTKKNRSILGVSVQYVFEENLKIRSIGMIELVKSHTASYLSTVIIDCLKRYDINLKQIVVITTDNGANVLKMVRDVESCLQEEINTVKSAAVIDNVAIDESVDDEIAQILEQNLDIEDDDATCFSIFEDVALKENETLLKSITNAMHADGLEILYDITGVNCAEHTLQLAIKDALKNTSHTVQNVIELSRRACKIFRLSSTAIEVQNAGIKYIHPRLENDTRWGSLFLMVCI